MTERELFFALLKTALCKAPLPDACREAVTDETVAGLYRIGKHHDLAHFVAAALSENGLLSVADEYGAKLQKSHFMAVYRYQQFRHELGRICELLEDAGIDALPLKGSVLRDLYPEPWMRTSCDIDLLIRPDSVDRASDALEAGLQYRYTGRSSHDLTLYAESGVHLELHFDLLEVDRANDAHEILETVWEYAEPIEGKRHIYRLRDDMFYYYHIAHMAKHFEVGGCGVRPFLDLWVLSHGTEYDRGAREALLETGKLLPFARACEALSEVWLGDRAHDDLTRALEEFILTGGVYGSIENRVAVNRNRSGGRLRYAMSRLFLPYERLKGLYPSLDGKKWLTPLYQVRRWGRMIFRRGGLQRTATEWRSVSEMSSEKTDATAMLRERLGL